MSDKPEKDILDEIMGRDPAYSGEAPEMEDAPETPPAQEDAAPDQERKPKPEPPKKGKRSSVYLYLFILFGAAFMMLLMAYFIQMRSNDTAISDLKDSMTLSREELMKEIKALEEEKEGLESVMQSLDEELSGKDEDLRVLNELLSNTQLEKNIYFWHLNYTTALSWLERLCAEGDWLTAAVVVWENDPILNPRNADFETLGTGAADPEAAMYPTAVQTARWLELREQVFDNAGCMTLWQSTTEEDGSDYTERPEIHIDDARKDALETARALYSVLSLYRPDYYSLAAKNLQQFYRPESGNLERLNGRYFPHSTVELVEQIKDELVGWGYLTEAEDGTLELNAAHIELGAAQAQAD